MGLCRTRLLRSFVVWSVGLLSMAGTVGLGLTPPAISRPSSSPPAAAALVSSQIHRLRLGPGRGHPRSLSPGVIHAYPFKLRKREFLRLIFDQQNVDATIDVFDPVKRKVLQVDTLNRSQGPEDVPFIAETAGVYEVRVSATSAGRYSARVVARRSATSRDRIRADSIMAYFRGEEAGRSHLPLQVIESYYTEAARLAGKVGETVHRADAFYCLGQLQCKAGRWADCRNAYSSALALYEDTGNISQQASVLNQIGQPLANLGEPGHAVEAFRRSIQLAQNIGRTDIEAIASLDLGLLQFRQGEIQPALENFKCSYDLSSQSDNPVEAAKALNASGRIYTFLGEVDQALELHGRALKLLGKKSGSEIAMTLVHVGDAYREADQFPYSISYYLRGLAAFRGLRDLENEAVTLNNLGLTYYHAHQYHDALDALIQAHEIYHQRGQLADEAVCWSNIGKVQISLNQLSQAMEAFNKARSINQGLNYRPAEAAAYFGMAWAERRSKNLIAALRDAHQAVDIIESLRSEAGQPNLRKPLLASRSNFYDLLVDLLMEQHRIQPTEGYDIEGFNASEKSRARALLDSLGEKSSPPPLSLSEIQRQVVDNDTILLEYYLGDERSFLWVVTPDSFASFELPSRSRLEPLVREVYVLIQKSEGREFLPEAIRKARQLSEILLGPVAHRLGGKRLLIVAPPALQYLPFAALPDLSVRLSGNSDLPWPTPLVERHEIVNAPSASVIAALRAIRRDWNPQYLLALLADPVYEPSDERLKNVRVSVDPLAGRFQRLEHSRDEAADILRIAGPQGVLDLRDFNASRARVVDGGLRSYRYLHFSAHGDPNAKHPERSSIVLSAFDAQGNPQDPYLRAEEIQNLGLSADLVVLSACETGLGQEVRGEGLVGLTQAFLSGGATGVVVSLWNVNDLATSQLMPIFYSNLLDLNLHLSPPAALQKAQVSMWRQARWNAPAYWAGFVEQGEWK